MPVVDFPPLLQYNFVFTAQRALLYVTHNVQPFHPCIKSILLGTECMCFMLGRSERAFEIMKGSRRHHPYANACISFHSAPRVLRRDQGLQDSVGILGSGMPRWKRQGRFLRDASSNLPEFPFRSVQWTNFSSIFIGTARTNCSAAAAGPPGAGCTRHGAPHPD